jgi:hypothetical protein
VKKYQFVHLLWLISYMNGQNLVDLRTQTKNVDFSSAVSTIPAKSGTALPATCNPGEMFFNTTGAPGQNLYTCAPANTWTLLAGGSTSTNGTVSTATAGQFGYYAANGSTIGGRTLVAGDIPALNYQPLLTFTGTGAKTATSTGSLVASDCAKWDVSGNIIDAGSPCASVASGSLGQFAFYAANGSALTAHTLAASDIPALSYQAPLTFTGTGTKAASSTGTLVSNDCAKWDASGNVIDSGAPCATGSANVGTGSAGQFAFYAANGSALTAHTLAASDIPALSYQAPLTFTGTGTKVANSTGTLVSNDCAKWDANGNAIDSGAPCASVATGSAGQFAFYSANGSALAAHTLAASDIPALSYQAPLTFTGTGINTASSTGTLVSNDCAKWDASGNVVDAGAPCGSGTGGGISAPSSTTVGNLPQFSNTTGTALSAGLGVVTSVGTPGLDTNVPTEKSVRTAIAAAAAAAGNLPAETGTASYLITDGATASWGDIATGGSGALDCASTPGVCDIVTALVPLKASANAWTGANDFSGAAFLRVATGAGVPATGCSVAANVGAVYMRNDAQTTGKSLYVCSQTASGVYSWELAQASGTAPLPVYNAAGAAMSEHMVTGRNSFFSSTATISLSGAAAFSSATTYSCTANDLSSATAILVTQTSGGSVTFSITGGGATDNFSYMCVGN